LNVRCIFGRNHILQQNHQKILTFVYFCCGFLFLKIKLYWIFIKNCVTFNVFRFLKILKINRNRPILKFWMFWGIGSKIWFSHIFGFCSLIWSNQNGVDYLLILFDWLLVVEFIICFCCFTVSICICSFSTPNSYEELRLTPWNRLLQMLDWFGARLVGVAFIFKEKIIFNLISLLSYKDRLLNLLKSNVLVNCSSH
jgi:hypothetical protein